MSFADRLLKVASKSTPKRHEDAFTIEPIRLQWLSLGGMLTFGVCLLGKLIGRRWHDDT